MKSVARVHLDGPLATLVLDDPGRRNLLGTEMFDAIEHGLEEAASSAVIRIRAEGPSFCSGFDLRASAQDTDALVGFVARLGQITRKLRRSSAVVLAEIQGPALAGGCALVSACDIGIASTSATFGYPVHRIGVSPAVSMPTLLDSMDHGAARALALSGELIDADLAMKRGLVHAVYEPGRLQAEAEAMCDRLLSHPETILAATKRSFEVLDELADDVALQRGTAYTTETANSEESKRMLGKLWARKASS